MIEPGAYFADRGPMTRAEREERYAQDQCTRAADCAGTFHLSGCSRSTSDPGSAS